MRVAKGPRPLSITAFALLFFAAALHRYVTGLNNLDLAQTGYQAIVPWDGWNRDWTIVTLSAIFSIAFIPVAWISLFASRIAFWLVTGFSVLKLADLPNMIAAYQAFGGAVSWQYFAETGLLFGALVCLWLPRSRQWLKDKGSCDVETFS